MTKEERAHIARANGAKSRGPKSPEGKEKSARNALKTGEHAQKFAHFAPPQESQLSTQERRQYLELVEQMVAIYRPVNQAAKAAVGDLAAARWQLNRLTPAVLALGENATTPAGVNAFATLNRERERLQRIITRAERQIKFIRTHFPDAAPEKRTERIPDPIVEHKGLSDEDLEQLRDRIEPIYTTEHTPLIIGVYRRAFPTRAIVILPTITN